MSDHTLLIVVFWALVGFDGALVGRRARFGFVNWLVGRRAMPAWRRWHILSPWPGGWRAMADDLPFSFSPTGVCNRPAGSAARPANTPDTTQGWRWEEIADVREQAGWLVLNGKKFCPATPLLSADELRSLAAACVALKPGARAALLRARLRRWLRPAHLRRRALALRALTRGLVCGNVLTLVGAAVLSAAFLGRLPGRVDVSMPRLLAGLLALHVALIGLAWWKRRRLLRLVPAGGPGKNPLPSVLFFPPGALRLRALLGADWFPPSHPVACALAFAPPGARDELVFNALADLRWPLVPGDGGPLAAEILTWFRASLGSELEELLRHEKFDADALFAPPAPDGTASRSYCPRCRAQFVGESGNCPQGVPLRPLK
jgi:hypothetical protein